MDFLVTKSSASKQRQLEFAITSGNEQQVYRLVEFQGADVTRPFDAKDDNQYCAIHHAVICGQSGIVRILLQLSDTPWLLANLRGRLARSTPLFLTLQPRHRYENLCSAFWLLRAGADPFDPERPSTESSDWSDEAAVTVMQRLSKRCLQDEVMFDHLLLYALCDCIPVAMPRDLNERKAYLKRRLLSDKEKAKAGHVPNTDFSALQQLGAPKEVLPLLGSAPQFERALADGLGEAGCGGAFGASLQRIVLSFLSAYWLLSAAPP